MNTLLKQKKEFEEKWGWYLPKSGRANLWNWIEKAIKEAREEAVEEYQKLEQMTYLGFKTPLQNKNELHNKIHKEGFEAGYKKGYIDGWKNEILIQNNK